MKVGELWTLSLLVFLFFLLGGLGLSSCHLLLPSGLPNRPEHSQRTSQGDWEGTATDLGSWPAGTDIQMRTGVINAYAQARVAASQGGDQEQTGYPLIRDTRLLSAAAPAWSTDPWIAINGLKVGLLRQEAQVPGTTATLITERTIFEGPEGIFDSLGVGGEVANRVVEFDVQRVSQPLGDLTPEEAERHPREAFELTEALPQESDDRFSGWYKGDSWELDIPVGSNFSGAAVEDGLLHVKLSQIELRLEHIGIDAPTLTGGIYGNGWALIENSCDVFDHPDCDKPEMRRIGLTVAGEVVSRGKARMLITGYHAATKVRWMGADFTQPVPVSVRASLSTNGEELTLVGLGESLSLQKLGATSPEGDFVNAARPSVSMVPLPANSLLPWGLDSVLEADVLDDGTGGVEGLRKVLWEERRQGTFNWRLFGVVERDVSKQRTRVRWKPNLEGVYEVRATAVDQGGLAGSATMTVTAASHPPFTPEIQLPSDQSVISVGGPTVFLGSAYDPEEGTLGGDSLTWFFRDTDAFPSVLGPLGPNNKGPSVVGFRFARAGNYEVTLVAVSNDGQSSSSSISVRVIPSGSNTKPLAVIESPSIAEGRAVHEGEPENFVGRASDQQDPSAALTVEWFVTFLGEQPFLIGTGPNITWDPPSPGELSNRAFELIFRATDSGGLSAEHRIEMRLWAEGETIE